MKFAKELEQDLVPEWRLKYLNYKAGKKHIKGVSKAIYRAANTPQPLQRPVADPSPAAATLSPAQASANAASPSHRTPRPVARPTTAQPSESDRLTGAGSGHDRQYGSFLLTPPARPPSADDEANNFQLPEPAINPDQLSSAPWTKARRWGRRRTLTSGSWCAPSTTNNAPPAMTGSMTPPSHALQRLFTTTSTRTGRNRSHADISMQSLDLVRERQQDFFAFLDSELEKVEKFYRAKEDHAGDRLALLREQLHEMRNCRIQEMAEARERERGGRRAPPADEEGKKDTLLNNGTRWIHPLKSRVFTPGPNSKAMQKMALSPVLGAEPGTSSDARRDYIRRAENTAIPYRTAKRKLKLALQEFYRGLELLKSYALLNRTAFRKLNKKYDKAVRARPPYRYLNERVNTAYFVTSDALDGYIQTVEDLYARYFEKNNRKVAVGKLRSLMQRRGDESASAFRNGVLIGTGLVFSLQGLSFAVKILRGDEDEELKVRTNYLLQIYGGYFLMLYLFILFCLDCRAWVRHKVNYPFIFELDPRHHLDWRQLAEFPSFLTFVFGLFMWLNFSRYGSEAMYLWYPVLLIVASAVLILLPAPILRSKSRSWFAYSHWRLLLAGWYPVEFRDFFLGDMYCSLTYATCNVELLFCLYAHAWENPSQCNSSSSRLLGFLSALPPIWRFLQCLRRYRDTRNVFPHLVNGGKYTMSIVAAVTLSLYRISPGKVTLGPFILFSAVNAIYCSVWDLFMDFSLLQPHSPTPLLRPITALKSRSTYYTIMTLDPILRFSWIAIAVFTHNPQHSTVVAFAVALLEATRRGMWALIRVENEHCANVGAYKASRDVPLPYEFGDEAAGVGLVVGDVEGAARNEGTGLSRILAHAHTQDFEKRRRVGVVGDGEAEEGHSDGEQTDAEGSGGISEDEGVKLP